MLHAARILRELNDFPKGQAPFRILPLSLLALRAMPPAGYSAMNAVNGMYPASRLDWNLRND